MFSSFARLSVRVLQTPKVLKRISVVGIDRSYSTQWTHRKPVEIMNEDDIFGVDEKGQNFDDVKTKSKRNGKRRYNQPQKKKKIKTKEETIYKTYQKDGIEFEFLKENDHKLTTLLTNMRCIKTHKEKNPKIILEGHRLITDAIKGGAIPSTFIFTRLQDVLELNLPKDVVYYKVPYKALQIWSNLTTSPGVMGIFTAPSLENTPPAANALPLTIICDNVRNPENLGAIIRAAAGVGCKKLILMKGCVDVWDFKVLRSAIGAHFRVPIYRNQDWAYINMLINSNADFIIADHNVTFTSKENSTDINQSTSESLLNISNNIVVDEVGNSKQHISSESDLDTDTDTDLDSESDSYSDIDSDSDSDSDFESDTDHFNIDSNSEPDGVKQQNPKVNLKQSSKSENVMRRLLSQLPIAPYHSVDYTKNETVLVIGGETEGLQLSSFEFIKHGTRVHIPLANDVDSLNVGMAVGIITFEVKRQLLCKNS